ncbi:MULTISPECIES: hypothetical protein [Flavobacteriaceae]|uniref:hypothetical protein n=1 Tax=Flavobacteriaceae TaxID=49546 RepID=UPI0010ADBED8|nr:MULTISPECIES: hypothetical protein [Flavobacteriaceae]NJB37605.1 hypothetical protein [Croceivirga sp. JEA036]TKD62434.1 hypothetical protein FBT53_09355 [Flavobacterium sp. ASW18X]
MIRYLLLVSLLFLGFTVDAQKNIYESASFDDLTDDHQILAILPFITQLELEQSPGEELKSLTEREAYAVQNALETYFSIRKKKKKFNVDFQETKETNRILKEKGIDYTNLDVYSTKELSKILGVDGIISGSLDLNVLLSKGVSTEFSFFDYFRGDANYGRIGIKIADGDTGKLLWKYEKAITKKTGKNTTELIDKMMKAASRKFPYDKEKKRRKNN